jgi:hypothetical protein
MYGYGDVYSYMRSGVTYVEYVVSTAKLTGIVLDFPAGLYTATEYPAQFPPGTAEVCRALAKQAWDVSVKLGIRYGSEC